MPTKLIFTAKPNHRSGYLLAKKTNSMNQFGQQIKSRYKLWMINFLYKNFKCISNFHLMTVLLLAPVFSYGQMLDHRDKLSIGLKTGMNISNVYDSEGEEFVADSKLGFAIGGFLTIPIGQLLAIQPELLFSQRGFKSSGRIIGGNYNMTRTSEYIDVPILFALRPLPFISFLLGPQYSFMTRQVNKFDNGTTGATQINEFENEDLRKNTYCITGGVDVNILRAVISGRFGRDIRENRADGTSSTPRYKNMWYQLTIGYRFF